MNWRHIRSILIVVGTYSVTAWLAAFVAVSGIAGTEYGGSGLLGALWICVREAAPRTVAAGAGTVVLWFVIGAAEARRWAWALAGLFATLGLVDRQFQPAPGVPVDQVSRVMELAVWCLLPAVGCLVAVWFLARHAPRPSGDTISEEAGANTTGGRRTAIIAWSALVLLAGGFAGMWISYSVQVARSSGWVAAMLESGQRAQYAYTQYREADYESARRALTQFASYLAALKPSAREWKPGQAPLADERSLAFDTMLTYGRLGVIADRAKHPDEAAAYWQRAEEEARALGWQEPTRERVRDTVIRLDAAHESAPTRPR